MTTTRFKPAGSCRRAFSWVLQSEAASMDAPACLTLAPLAKEAVQSGSASSRKWTWMRMRKDFTRRGFAKAAGAAAIGATTAPLAGVAQTPAEDRPNPASGNAAAFPPGFSWGVATSAFQIEGA